MDTIQTKKWIPNQIIYPGYQTKSFVIDTKPAQQYLMDTKPTQFTCVPNQTSHNGYQLPNQT